jgi:hypothetical protein
MRSFNCQRRCLHRRPGFAIRELLMIVLVIGMVLGGYVVIVQPVRPSSLTPGARLMDTPRYCDIDVGEEFVCQMDLTKFSKSDSGQKPYYVSRLRIARRDCRSSEPFLLEILSFEQSPREIPAVCRVWTLMSEDAVSAYLRNHRETTMAASARQQQEFTKLSYLAPQSQAVDGLEDIFWQQLPAELRKTGRLVVTTEVDLQHLYQVQGFPLNRVASAIRLASGTDIGELPTLSALLQQPDDTHQWLTDDDVQTVARLLLQRLTEHLP